MKRYIFTIFILSALLMNLSGCSDSNDPLLTQSSGTGAAVNTTKIKSTDIHITVNGKNKTSIPDPATAEKNVAITLRDPGQDSVLDNYECKQCNLEKGKFCNACKEYFFENYFADLSFVGFKKPVHISSFAIGCMTERNSSDVQFYLREKGAKKEEKKEGNCLALFVTAQVDEMSNKLEDSLHNGKNYLVILDYKNKRCYKTKTEFSNWLLHWTDLKFTDVTGDGREELVIQRTYNKSIMLEIHRFDKDKRKIRKIFSNWDNDNIPDYTPFSGCLKNDYKAVLEYKKIGFTKTVSLLDAGYKRKNLEVDNVPADADTAMDDYDSYQFVRLWKNGKLQADGKKPGKVFLYTLDEVSFVKNKKNIPLLRLVRSVYIGHRSERIGEMYTYFQYNSKKDILELTSAKFKIRKED